MLSEEEKKAIEWLIKRQEFMYSEPKCVSTVEECIDILLNLIDKQQKEIEELKEKNKKQFLNYEKRANELEYKQLNYISKDKIRELLEKYDKSIAWANADDHYYFNKYINELLEE